MSTAREPLLNQAFNALLSIFRHVLDKDIAHLGTAVRAGVRRRLLPVVLTVQEIEQVLTHLGGVYQRTRGKGKRKRQKMSFVLTH